ncbi:MAG: T9SS type A sorting domain-containing protein [Bacteroidia bacterium]|nr:T9SS type A sorting domain-containing protein [Bacteroidia bacterium]
MKINKSTGDSIWSDKSVGTISSFDFTADGKIIAAGGGRMYLLNDTGGVIWYQYIFNTVINCIRSTFDGDFIAAGYYYQGLSQQQLPMLLKTDSLGNFTAGIEDFNIQVQNYSIIPNPVTEQSQLLFGNARGDEHEFMLFDLTGRVVEKQRTHGNNITLTRSNHTAGMYIFQLQNTVTGEVINGKVVMLAYR